MLNHFFKLLQGNIKITSIFVLSISLLSVIPLVNTIALINICAFLCGLSMFFGYVIHMGCQIRGENDATTTAILFSGEAKYKSDFLLLLLFFGAIIILFKAPFYLFSYIAGNKVSSFLSSASLNYYSFILLSILFGCIYKTVLYSSFASLGYHKNEVIEAFKTGLKGLYKFKLLLLIIFVIEVAFGFLPLINNELLVNIVSRLQYIWPPFVVIFMLCAYGQADQLVEDRNNQEENENLAQQNI